MAVRSCLHIEAGMRNEVSFLRNSFASQPLKLADITEDRSVNELRLMIMSSSPGVLDRDEYEVNIELSEWTNVHLQTQSYQRLFQMKYGAVQAMNVKMEKNSSFCFIAHPAVPHEGSIFSAKNKIYMTTGCSLVWGEILSCGRKLNGEAFRYSSYHSLTQIFYNDRLVVKENLLIKPALIEVAAIGQMEGFSHQATMIFINENIKPESLMVNLATMITDDIVMGYTELPVKGIIVRLLGNRSEQLFELLKEIALNFIDNQNIKSTSHVA